jgi:hypothetical protein
VADPEAGGSGGYSTSSGASNYREVVASYGSSSRQTLARDDSLRFAYGSTADEFIILFGPSTRQTPYSFFSMLDTGKSYQQKTRVSR